MRKFATTVCLVFVAAGLTLAGCKEKTGDDEKGDKKAKKQAAEKKADEKEQDTGTEKAEDSLSKEDYVQASVELACVDEQLGDSEDFDSEKVEADILGQYGLDEESYGEAEKKFADDKELTKKIDKKLEDCNEQKAKEYAGLTADAGAAGEEEEKEEAKPSPEPPATGKFEGTVSDKSGFESAKLSLRIQDDFDARFTFNGKREKGFRITGEGKVEKDGTFNISGSEGSNEVRVVGKLDSDNAKLTVKGKLWDKSFTLSVPVS